VQSFAERAWYYCSRAIGQMLRAGRYANVRIVREAGQSLVLKRRSFHAPVFVWMGGPLMKALGTGVRVLPQRAWEKRERAMYQRLYDLPVRSDDAGTLVLPCLPGETLAALLENPTIDSTTRMQAVALAARALRELHAHELTHGDAMAENVLVDLAAGVARWFDFETLHESGRSAEWCRADDLRALIASCLLRTSTEERAATLHHMLDAYSDETITREVLSSFASVFRLSRIFHLGQAPLPLESFRGIHTLLRERVER
jgi:tRNA A-37 threonylcarbamoyl transferase component Bud32